MKYLAGFIFGVLFCIFVITIDSWNGRVIQDMQEKNQKLIEKNNALILYIQAMDSLIETCIECDYKIKYYGLYTQIKKLENKNE